MRSHEIIYSAATAALLIGTMSCGGGVKPADPTRPHSTPVASSTLEIPKNGNYDGKGKVTKINNELGSVEFDHKEIPGLMPPMIMEFFVKDKALLQGLNVGDEVDFVIEYNHPSETVVSITKSK